ncbi:MAG: hydrogenase maturation protease [Proteobacteria bacterium]|nr:hydrogenase maturation protease [Pseudomonadota bacterium]MBU1688744.1 hydrogenase maturation protease [Pseudomonadota bacterium]
MKKIRTILIGLGNPYLGDDGVGVQVVRRLREVGAHESLTLVELPVGGMRLMECMVGYDRAIIVDAVQTGRHEPGLVMKLKRAELDHSLHSTCSHDTNLEWALETGRSLGLVLPSEIWGWGIEAGRVDTFGERMSPAVVQAVLITVKAILTDLASFEDYS